MDYERKPTTALAGVFIISNAALGAGTLAFPQAFAKTGLYLSLPILAVSVILVQCNYFEYIRFYEFSGF